MPDAASSWIALCGLVFLLGLRHGFDADHLATIDALTRLNQRRGLGVARWCGVLFSLEPTDRAWLHARIAERFDAMLAAGFLDEVKALRARGDLSTDLPSMRCVGYRQAWEMLDACSAEPPDAKALNDLRERGIAATRQLAKRQITWLRSMPTRTVIACDAPDAVATAVQLITSTTHPG